MLLRTCRTAGTRGRRCLSVISEYPSISEELRDRFTPTHPTLKMREQDNNGNGVDREADLPVRSPLLVSFILVFHFWLGLICVCLLLFYFCNIYLLSHQGHYAAQPCLR